MSAVVVRGVLSGWLIWVETQLPPSHPGVRQSPAISGAVVHGVLSCWKMCVATHALPSHPGVRQSPGMSGVVLHAATRLASGSPAITRDIRGGRARRAVLLEDVRCDARPALASGRAAVA